MIVSISIFTGCGCACWTSGSCNKEQKHLEEPQIKVQNTQHQMRKGETWKQWVHYSQVESGSKALSSLSISNRTPTSNSTSLDHCGKWDKVTQNSMP